MGWTFKPKPPDLSGNRALGETGKIVMQACIRKVKMSEKHARERAALVRKKEGYGRAYQCDVCGSWHITSKETP